MEVPATMMELYAYMERHVQDLEGYDFTNAVVKYRNSDVPDQEKQWAQWEVESFLFEFRERKIFSFSTSPGKDVGQLSNFPSLDDFQNPAFEYLKRRADEAMHPLLVARYNHLLWKAPKGIKNKKYALQASKAYFQSINLYIGSLSEDGHEVGHIVWEISRLFELLCALCVEVREFFADLSQLAKELVYQQPLIPFYIKHSLFRVMLNHKKVFKAEDFDGGHDIYAQELDKGMERGSFLLWVNDYIPTAISIGKFIKSDIRGWYDRLGDCYVSWAEKETKDDRLWMKYMNYVSAVDAYRQSGNKDKKKQTEQIVFELKSKITLPTVRINREQKEIDNLQKAVKFVEAGCNELLKHPHDIVYKGLADGWHYPSGDIITESAQNKEYLHEELLTPVEFDRNKNIRRDNNGQVHKRSQEIYNYSIETVTQPFLHFTFVNGIKSGKLTYGNFISYLSDTWVGHPYLTTNMGGQEFGVNWLTMISPAILEYFRQTQSWLLSESYEPNYILCVDSLTLKMEGLLRNFAQRVNISTTVGGKHGTQEAYMNGVLDDERIKAYFPEDDILFFRYLFANEGGLNLRNNIAHCFYNFSDYHINKMHLLLAALLKIANFSVEESMGQD